MSPLINLKKRQIDNKCLRFSNVGKLKKLKYIDPRNCKSIPLNTSLEQTFVLFPGQRYGRRGMGAKWVHHTSYWIL